MPEPTPNLSGTQRAFPAEAAATGPSSSMGLGDGERSHRENGPSSSHVPSRVGGYPLTHTVVVRAVPVVGQALDAAGAERVAVVVDADRAGAALG